MNWIKSLTPKNTEEVKPGLFIQKTQTGKYRHIHPAAWDGKVNWKNLVTGGKFWGSFFWFLILMALAFSYYTNTKSCVEFQANPCEYLTEINEYCIDIGETLNWEEDGEQQRDTLSLQDILE